MSKSSKNRIKVLTGLLLCVAMLTGLGTAAYAAESGGKKVGSITIQPQYNSQNVTSGTYSVYHVATVVEGMQLRYALKAPFDTADVEINEVKTAEQVGKAAAALKNAITSDLTPIVVGAGETAKDLELGVYLVVQRTTTGNYTASSPFLVFLPMYEDSVWVYEAMTYPKLGYDEPGGGDPPDPPDPPNPPYTPPGTPPTEIPEDPTPLDPADPPIEIIDPEIPLGPAPQTGMLQWPIPVLTVLGALMIGVALLMGRDKKKYGE